MMEAQSSDSQARQLEWQAFYDLALSAVRAGFSPETASGERIERLFQIVELPSFDAVVGWQLFRITARDANGSGRYIAARARWDQKQDVGMFYRPVERLTMLRLKYLKRLSPALTFTAHPLQGAIVREVEDTMARLLSTPVLLLPNQNRLGLDGTSHELAMGDSWAGIRFHWWEQAPPEWEFLQETVVSLLNTLESLMVEEVQE